MCLDDCGIKTEFFIHVFISQKSKDSLFNVAS